MAIQWNVASPINGEFHEVFTPGSLSWPADLRVCLRHDKTAPIASLTDGTWRLAETPTGLWCELDCPDTVEGNRWLHGTRFGEYFGWSLCFYATDKAWDRPQFELPVCTVKAAELYEISLVKRPAHQTTIGIKSRLRARGIVGPFEAIP